MSPSSTILSAGANPALPQRSQRSAEKADKINPQMDAASRRKSKFKLREAVQTAKQKTHTHIINHLPAPQD